MTEQQLGAVVVGTGFGVLTHLRAMRAADINVVALVGRDPKKTAERAAMYDVPNALVDLDAALALDGVDLVSVVTPPYTHREIVTAAAAAGKHILCEKPFARDLKEAMVMLNAVQDAGVVHILGTEFRFATAQAQLTRVVRSGVIGDPLNGIFQLHIPTLSDPAAEIPGWWELAAEGGGWFGAYGSHVVDQIRATLGEFVGVSASLQRVSPRPGMTADDTYTIHFRLANGCTGMMASSCASAGQMLMTTKITGSKGSAWIEGEDVWTDTGSGPIKLDPPKDLPHESPEPPPASLLHTTYDYWHSMGVEFTPYRRTYEVMRDQVLGRDITTETAPATFEDGVAAQAVADAVHRSSAQAGWESV